LTGKPVSPSASSPPVSQSKRALKRLIRKQKWIEHRPEKRKLERQRRKEAKQRWKAEAAVENSLKGPDDVAVISTALRNSKLRSFMKLNVMKNSECKVGVAIDMSFDNYMAERVSYYLQLISNLNHKHFFVC